jgi:DNA-binding beta-propeller fold protein YncE
MEAIVSILDVDAKVVIRNVHLTDLGVPANSKPHHIALSPDGQNWFVSLIDNQVNKILKFNMANELLGEVVTDVPAMLAYHPTDDVLYSSRFMDPQVPLQSIFALNANTMAPINQSGLTDGTIVLPSFVPHAMALSMTGDKVFTASLSENTVMIVDHATKSYEESIPLGDGKTPLQLSISPDRQRRNCRHRCSGSPGCRFNSCRRRAAMALRVELRWVQTLCR